MESGNSNLAQTFVIMVGFDVEVAFGAGKQSRLGLGLGLGLGEGLHLPPCGDYVDESHEVDCARVEESADEDGGNHHAQKLVGGHNVTAPVGATWHEHSVGYGVGKWSLWCFFMTCDMWDVDVGLAGQMW